jgi:hypothetical protein
MLETKTITITLQFPEEKKMSDYDPRMRSHIAELAAAMNHEVEKGGGGLVPTEANMIRSYIAWKLLYEPKAVSSTEG